MLHRETDGGHPAAAALEPITVRLEGDHLLREPLELLEAEGFAVDELERSKLGMVERVSARKPSGAAAGAAGGTAAVPSRGER
ncbi:MAG TPA: hypothetical protein VIV57_15120 [Anaeromyxobacter sp.]